MFLLTGKTAAITGGGSGIGKAIAKLFARQQANVAIIELNKVNGESTLQEITEAGGKATLYTCDVSRQEEVKRYLKGFMLTLAN
jgi:2-keto-3-deoxy-L-fuconate dehydrogenase